MDDIRIFIDFWNLQLSIRDIGDGSLSCDVGQRYLRLRQVHSREEIRGTKVVQIDSSTLHSTGAFVWPASFDIKVLHQGYAGEKGLTMLGSGEELGDEAERFQDAILALQSVGRSRQSVLQG